MVDVVAVHQRRDPVPGHQRGTEQDAQRAAEIRVIAGVQPARAIQQALFRGGEVGADEQQQRGREQRDDDDGQD